MGAIGKLAVVVLLGLGLEGCAGAVREYAVPSMAADRGQTDADNQKPLQCVPYARAHSGIKIFGDAYTWWDQAAGKYPRGSAPLVGSVMVLRNYAGPTRGHVAVVREVVAGREIRVDHADWLDDGAIYLDDPVTDVSAANDWSLVRVFNLKTGAWGGKVYPVQGFIGGSEDRSHALVADGQAGSGVVPTAWTGN